MRRAMPQRRRAPTQCPVRADRTCRSQAPGRPAAQQGSTRSKSQPSAAASPVFSRSIRQFETAGIRTHVERGESQCGEIENSPALTYNYLFESNAFRKLARIEELTRFCHAHLRISLLVLRQR